MEEIRRCVGIDVCFRSKDKIRRKEAGRFFSLKAIFFSFVIHWAQWMQKNWISKGNRTDEWRRLGSIHESPRCALDDHRFCRYFLLIILLFFSYLFSTLISCFSIKHTAVVELSHNFNIYLSHVPWNIKQFWRIVYVLFVKSKREFF